MIKTLRITSIIVAILAAVLAVFPAVFGVRSDEQAEKFLNSAGVIDQFRKVRGDKARATESRTSPLVKQAEAFARFLSPITKPRPERTATTYDKPAVERRPSTVSAKFTLEGTSYHPSRPQLSLALIDRPGKGLRWVRQASKVGHLVIEQVKDGLIVVRDGDKTFELIPERPEKTSLVKGPVSDKTSVKPFPPVFERPGMPIIKRKSRPARRAAGQRPNIGKAFLDELQAVQDDIDTDETDSKLSEAERKAALAEMLAELKAMYVNTKEAKKLNHLGRQLESADTALNDIDLELQYEPNQFEDDITESDANLSELDLNEPNLSEPDSNLPDLNEPNLAEENSPDTG